MAAPLGNKNAIGNSGGKKGRSGRKSAYDERADAETLHHMFFDEHDQAEIEAAITRGKFSVKDRFILTAMEGDASILNTHFKKLFPDKMEVKEETTLKIDV